MTDTTAISAAVRMRDRHGAISINGIRFDPATAAHVASHPGGDCHFESETFRRFDEELYKTPEGYWFIVRPLAPDEAEASLEAHGDEVLLRQTFPDDEGAE